MRRAACLVALASLALVPSSPLAAQSAAPKPAAAPAAAPAAEPTPGAMAAAEELLRLMEIEPVMRAGALSMLELQIQQQPELAPFRDVLQAWAEKYLTWEEMGPRLTRIYAEAFTEPELRDLVAFFRTPTGRKLASLQPMLTEKGAQAGAAVAEKHAPELESMIMARAMELQQGAGAP